MRSAIVQYHRDIAKLKRTVDEQRRQIEFLKAQERSRLGCSGEDAETTLSGNVRWSARSVRSQRKRLGLSAEDFCALINVSAQTIYNWERGETRPRDEQFAAFVEIRGSGRRFGVWR